MAGKAARESHLVGGGRVGDGQHGDAHASALALAASTLHATTGKPKAAMCGRQLAWRGAAG